MLCRLSALIALASCVAIAALACSGADEQPAVAEQATPQPETRAAPPPAVAQDAQQQAQPSDPARPPADPLALLVAEAAALEHNGYWEQALAVRESAIASGEPCEIAR